MKCEICGKEDLLMACNMGPTCAVCTMKFFQGGQPRKEDVAKVRESLGLKDGEYFELDHGAEASKILGRKGRRR